MSASPPASEAALLDGLALACAGFAVGAILVWCVVFAVRAHRLKRARREARAEEALTGLVLDQLSGYSAAALHLPTLPRWKRRLLLRVLQRLIEQTKGRDQTQLIGVLHAAGFQTAALQNLRRGRAAERQQACSVLGYFDDESSIAALHAALGDEDDGVRLTAARALLQKDRVESLRALLRCLPFPPDDPPLALAEIFAHLPARLRPEAVALLQERALPSEWLRLLAIALARRQAFEAFDAIAALRHAPEPRVRAAAWVALTELGDPRAGEFVVEGLADPSPDVRQVAGHCAGRLGGPDVIAPLAAQLGTGSWWSRYHAANALLACGRDGAAALEAYLASAPDDDPARQAWRENLSPADGR
jgi:HEAT repeat protein